MFVTEINQPSQNTTNTTIHEYHDCPNCWGYLQWDGQDCKGSMSIDKGSKSEIFSRNGFIRRFIKKYIG
ncbi:MAG: hypothetical protein AB8F94_02110 [Saprospiraceae bacterium]